MLFGFAAFFDGKSSKFLSRWRVFKASRAVSKSSRKYMWMASLVTRFTGLCLTYVAISFAAEKVRQPLAEMVKRGTLLDDLMAALDSWVEATLGKNGSSTCQPESAAPIRTVHWPSTPSCSDEIEWDVVEVDPTDLCSRCVDSRSTIMELHRVAQSMGIPYPGDPFEPCQLCCDRAHSLYKLERRFGSFSEGQQQRQSM